ncbi:PREDICTED: uncharacterized protein LOC109483908 [Branchiostoma belcheri]|uniref:Uncharacterized protein LOC109483908 n=1 Tax=Branchiostoma belcheri TaxID=7741 RepID=A0A6P5AKQ3_BRABE|nr:PREDICTED: uncharacterized protein LOC109483908 [Branchiostoma belcheri]
MGCIKLLHKNQPIKENPVLLEKLQSLNETASRALHVVSTMEGKTSSDQISSLGRRITTYQTTLQNSVDSVGSGTNTTDIVDALSALQIEYWPLSRMLTKTADTLSHGGHTIAKNDANTVYGIVSEFAQSHDTIMQIMLNATSQVQLTEFCLTFRATVCQYSLCFGHSDVELTVKEDSWILGGITSPTETLRFDQYLTFREGNKVTWKLAGEKISTSVSVDFQIFGETKTLTLSTEDTIAHIQGSIVLSQIPIYLVGHCNIHVDTGSTLRWNITILFLHHSDGLPRLVRDRLETYLSDILTKSDNRYELAQKSVESLENLFSQANADFNNSNQSLESIEQEYATALSELEDSENELQQLEQEFESDKNNIQNHLNALDALCELQTCPVVQTPGVKCSACTRLYTRKIPERCCTPCYKTRRVIEQYECQTTCFDWSETCTVTHYCRCSFLWITGCSFGDIVKCTAQTDFYPCSENCSKSVTYYDETECCKTCYQTETGYVQTECCEEVPNLTVTQDPTCLSENEACRSVRSTVFSRYEHSWGDVTTKLASLQSARSRRNTNQINLENLRVQLDAQRLHAKEREALSERYRLSLSEAKLVLTSVKTALGDSFKLRGLFNGTDMAGLQIVNVSSTMTLTSNTSKIIPLKVLVQVNSRLHEVGMVLDLDSIETSLANGVEKIGRTIFGNIDAALHAVSTFSDTEGRRRKRATTETTDLTTDSCHTFNEISTYLTEIVTLIQEFEREQLRMKLLFMETEQHLLALKQNVTLYTRLRKSAYNKTILVDYFNITSDSDKDIQNISQEAQATLKLIETISFINRNNEDTSTGTAAASRLYVAYEEVTRNASYFDVCFGFRDCILQVLEDYYNLLYPTEEPEVIAMESNILEVRDSLEVLLNDTSLNRSNIYWNLQNLMTCINATSDGNWLCGTAPNIQLQPSVTNKVLQGNDLTLECNATGEPDPKYEWIKDSRIKLGNSTELMLKNVKEEARGEYVCIASNRFGSSSTVPIQVDVTSKPQLTQHPLSQELALGSEVGTTMNCSAAGTPTPLIRWFFRKNTLSNWDQVNNGTASDYILIIHPTWQDEGWYACRAENEHGQTMSEPAFLMILGVTVAVPTVNITFQLTDKHKESVDIDTPLPGVKHDDLTFSTQIPSTVTVAHGRLNESLSTTQPEINITSAPDVNAGYGVDFERMASILEDITGLGSVAKVFLMKEVFDTRYERRLQITINGRNLTNGTDYLYLYPHYAKKMTFELNEFQSRISELEQATEVGNITALYGGQNINLDPSVFEVLYTEFLCPSGQGVDENGYICVNCPPGKYRGRSDLFWSPECRPCPKGFYQDQQGQETCEPCPEGTTTYSTGTRSSTLCYEPCSPGHFSDNGIMSQNCSSCPEDTYQVHWEQTSCTECPPGRGTRLQGATSPDLCEVKCNQGQFSETGFEPCTLCPKGSFQNRTGQTTCLDCNASLTTTSSGSTSSKQCREPCHAGYYFFASGTSDEGECSPCPKGYFLPRPRDPREEMRKCMKCPFGQTTSSVGATSSDDCGMSCRPGSYSDSGLLPCTPCTNGTYQPEEGMKQCMTCPNGTKTETEGSTQCKEIPNLTPERQSESAPRKVIICLSVGIGIGALTTIYLLLTKKLFLVRRTSRYKAT